MLIAAAILTVLLALMHSILGARRLITPITRMEGLPAILGSRRMSELTLHVGWHLLSLTWLGMAGVMVAMQVMPSLHSHAFLWFVTGVFGVSGLLALFISRGRHLSWVLFLPVAILAWLSL